MLKNSFILFLLLALFTLASAATHNTGIEVLQDNGSSIILEFEVNEYTVETVDI
jgi:hypothetical protein